MTILDDILRRKAPEIAALGDFPAISRDTDRSFVRAVQSMHPSFILEIKPASPSRGKIIEQDRIPTVLSLYKKFAQCISVLCDHASFGGGFDLLESIRKETDLPLLAKDFVISTRQIDAAVRAGADAILLIAALLEDAELDALGRYAHSKRLDILLEVHTEDEADRVIRWFKKLSPVDQERCVIGINNRDLKRQVIDIEHTRRLAPNIRAALPHVILISESGISSGSMINSLQSFVDGFLIGTSVLTAEDPAALLHSFRPS